MNIEKDGDGIKITDGDNIYHITTDLVIYYGNSHGDGSYTSKVKLNVWKEDK